MKRLYKDCTEDCRFRAGDEDLVGCGHCILCMRAIDLKDIFNITQERIEEALKNEPRPDSTN